MTIKTNFLATTNRLSNTWEKKKTMPTISSNVIVITENLLHASGWALPIVAIQKVFTSHLYFIHILYAKKGDAMFAIAASRNKCSLENFWKKYYRRSQFEQCIVNYLIPVTQKPPDLPNFL